MNLRFVRTGGMAAGGLTKALKAPVYKRLLILFNNVHNIAVMLFFDKALIMGVRRS
jgi:hypothetical protein